MNVGQLIKELEKMPKHVQIGYSGHDNSKYEVSDWPVRVELIEKLNFIESEHPDCDMDMFEAQPKRWVVMAS